MQVQAKVIVIGGVGVGKSSLTIRYVSGEFNEHLQSTLGAVYFEKKVRVGEKEVKYAFWDTAGQQRYRAVARIYYKECKAAVVVYDVTARESFLALKEWVSEVATHGPSNILIAIVGNKVDLTDGEHDAVPYAEAYDYATSIGAIFKYTSAKDGKGVEELFDLIAHRLLEKTESVSQYTSMARKQSHQLVVTKKKSKCC